MMRGVVKVWFTLSELSKKLDMPYNTLNRYVNRHSQFLKIKKEHKHYLVHEESLDLLLIIRELYLGGHTQKTVDIELLNRNVAVTIVVEDETSIETLSTTLQAMKTDIDSLRKHSEQQENFNRELLMMLEKQHQHIGEHIERRDKLLLQSIKESMEARRELAATKEKWWQFWK